MEWVAGGNVEEQAATDSDVGLSDEAHAAMVPGGQLGSGGFMWDDDVLRDQHEHGLPKGDLEEHRDRLIDFLNLVDKARIPKVCVCLCRYVRQLLGSIL